MFGSFSIQDWLAKLSQAIAKLSQASLSLPLARQDPFVLLHVLMNLARMSSCCLA